MTECDTTSPSTPPKPGPTPQQPASPRPSTRQPDPALHDQPYSPLHQNEYPDNTNLVDYGNRRQQLANWSIPAQQWAETVLEHAEPTLANRIPPAWGDHKRRFVSWMVWTAVTSGERRLAPTSILPATKDEDHKHDRCRIVHYRHELNRATGPHCHQLAKIIDRYTEQTITAVDARS